MDSVEYDFQEDDAVAFGVVTLRLSSVYAKALRSRTILGCVAIALVWAVGLRTSLHQWPTWFFLVVVLTLFLLIVPKMNWRRMPGAVRRQIQTGKNKALLGSQELHLLEACVKRVHPLSESQVAWSAVEKLVSSQKFLGIYIGSNHAFVVPKRSFKSPRDESAFCDRVERLSGKQFVNTPY